MTKKERINPQVLQASRKKRISAGSGTEVSELNRLIKMHRQMSDMMKKMGRGGNRGMLKGMMSQMFGKGGSSAGYPLTQSPENNSMTSIGSMPNLNLPRNLSGFGKKK